MKKTLVALAAVSAAAGAFAQSNVTIYGTLDASVAYVKNSTDNTGKSATYLNDSAISTSRWGMRGTEDLGGGLKANFNLESDVNMGTGANNPAGMFRRSCLCLPGQRSIWRTAPGSRHVGGGGSLGVGWHRPSEQCHARHDADRCRFGR